LGNLLNDINAKILKRDSSELVKGLRSEWIKRGSRLPPDNEQDAEYKEIRKQSYKVMNMENDVNNTRELWLAATCPDDEMFELILQVCHKI
jgi:hypothetical protein